MSSTALQQQQIDHLVSQAEHLLQHHAGSAVWLSNGIVIAERSRSTVIRCQVTGWPEHPSVIIKHHTGDDTRCFTDWASLQFLAARDPAGTVAPRFYAGDSAGRMCVMEDLGGSMSLENVLQTGDRHTMQRILPMLGRTMAKLVAATVGQEAHYAQMRTTLPGTTGMGREAEAQQWLTGVAQVANWGAAFGLALPPGFSAACQFVAQTFAAPGPYLAFSHGDPAPSNNHIAGEQVHLLDFEYGGYRHALYDLTGWYILCPLPEAWVDRVEQSFRQALAGSSLAALMILDEPYMTAWATLCAYRALAMLSWFSADLMLADRPWAPGWSMRAAFISTTRRLHQATAQYSKLQPLAEFGWSLAAAAQTRWPHLGDGSIQWPANTR